MNKKSLYVVESEIRKGDHVVFNNGDVLIVKKYNAEKHLIKFTNGTERDLYIIYDNCVSDIYHPSEIVNLNNKKIEDEKPSNFSKKNKVEKTKKSFSIYGLASGKPGKKFTIEQFLEITKNAKKKPGGSNSDKSLELDDGYVYEADSQQEISTLKKLISNNAFKRLRGQCINIPYKFGGKKSNYFPDFIMLTQTKKIVIMEVKEIVQMNTKINIRKYEALKRYCEKNGYLYIMCDKSFKTFERLSNYNVGFKVQQAIEIALESKGYFNYDDFKELTKDEDHKKVKKIRNSIGIYVKSHKNLKMIGDLNFKSADFKIKKIKNR